MKQSTEQLTPLQRAVLALEKMQARLNAATVRIKQIQHEPIAVIGMGYRFPGQSDHPAAFWQLLKDGRDAVGQAPLHRWGRGFVRSRRAGIVSKQVCLMAAILRLSTSLIPISSASHAKRLSSMPPDSACYWK